MDRGAVQRESSVQAIHWMQSRVNEVLAELDAQFAEFRLSEALMGTYRLVWDDFCSWYLELVKPAYGEPMDGITYDSTVELFESILKILHPFMPFQTEEIWHWIGKRPGPSDALCIAPWPTVTAIDEDLLADFETFKLLVSEVRTVRKENQIPHRDALVLHVDAGEGYPVSLQAALSKLCNLSAIEITKHKVSNSFGFLVGRSSFFIPFGDAVDVEAEKAKIQKEIDHISGFLKAVQGKLSNDRFVSNAPESVVVLERKKEADALSKLEVLNSKLTDLG